MLVKLIKLLLSAIFPFITLFNSFGQSANDFKVLAYFAGSAAQLDSFDVQKITHIIYCFGHLDGNRFKLGKPGDTLIIQKMVSLKSQNPQLKVLVSLGGWAGCETCSDVFATKTGRKEFAGSVKEVQAYFQTDGIDLDWEYPAIEGPPGHTYTPEDKRNFTLLVNELRKELGKESIVSFAAGGFTAFLDKSVEWKKVMKKVDFVNLMTYDLVNGYAKATGHHTPLYGTPQQTESTDHAVNYLINLGIPSNKLIIGGAFYSRIFENVPPANNGLYQPGKFKTAEVYKNFPTALSADSGFVYYWDEVAKAPYLYNEQQKLFVTFDDRHSLDLKAKYVVDKKLGGIMFWQLAQDIRSGGLLDAIHEVKKSYTSLVNPVK